MRPLKSIPAIMLLAASTMMSQAHAVDAFMKTGKTTSQPIGHYELCRRMPQECNIRTNTIEPITLTQGRWDMILAVNHSVNTRIRPETDLKLYGKEEYWAYPVTAGDCEDYVLQKRLELHKKGFPLSALLITVVRKPDGEGHSILTVRTNRGDFVLDNLRNAVLNWKDTGYTFLKRQSSYNTGLWVRIEKPEDVVIGSANSGK